MSQRCLWLDLPRDELYRRIDARVLCMIDNGLIDEARALRRLPRPLSREASQALGYKEVFEHLDGQVDLQETICRIQTRSRHFAKSQLSLVSEPALMSSCHQGIDFLCLGLDNDTMTITFQVLDGVDKGRIYRDLTTPLTIGREEGNALRLNDERVSRFHAKVQADNNEIILIDLDSTNGTRVNGNLIQIRRLRPGDRVGVGRSLLLFGSEQEIANRVATLSGVLPGTAAADGHDPQAISAAIPGSTIRS